MATVDWRTGQIVERKTGFKKFCYATGSKNKAFLKECLKAHETIIGSMRPSQRQNIDPAEFKSMVMAYVGTDSDSRKKIIAKIVEADSASCSAPLEIMVGEWYKLKTAGVSKISMLYGCNLQRRVALDFFRENNLRTAADLRPGTASEFIEWRTKKTYNPNKKTPTSASKIRHELQVLKQMASIAYANDWIKKPDIWNKAKVASEAGINMKIVEPLSIEAQKDMLAALKDHSCYHDTALALLLTGMRLGDLREVKRENIRNSILSLHGSSVGSYKTTGKTASASRNIPVCKTLEKIFERGHIFGTTVNSFVLALKRYFTGIHAHRLRHSFAVNKLLAQVPLQMVSYQMGHASIGLTADLYGKFVPEYFKAGFEEAIRERKEWVDFLENRYF
jgi:integrase